MERECYDMFGIRFEGHRGPAAHPARRRLGGPPAVEVLRGGYTAPTVSDRHPCRPDARVRSPTARVELDYAGSERLTMNMGPQHPSAHGVFRAILTLEGRNGRRPWTP